jgi:O-methyltransferase
MRHASILGSSKLDAIERLCRESAALPGDLAELGVYRGGAGLLMAGILPAKTIHLFDTFSGMPVSTHDDHHKVGEFSETSLESVQALYRDVRAEFHVGLFPDTAKDLTEKTFCVVHLDADQYTSTRDGIAFFWPRLVPGGVLVFDDYRWQNCPGVERAVREHVAANPHLTIEETTKHQCVLRKPL